MKQNIRYAAGSDVGRRREQNEDSGYASGRLLVVAVFVFWTHRANIVRLRRGEEPRFGRKSPETPSGPPEPPAVTRS